MPPNVAVRAHVELVAGIAGQTQASLWAPTRPAVVTCLARSTGSPSTRRLKTLARRTIEEDAVTVTGVRSPIIGIPVRRAGSAYGTLAVGLRDHASREQVEALAQLAAARISLMLERQMLLERGDLRARTVVQATERRLVRTAYDLHDGPLQGLALLAEEVRLVAADVRRLVPGACREPVSDAFASVLERAADVERELREIGCSLETSAVSRRPLEELIEREALALTRRTGIEVVTDLDGGLEDLSDSQRIVLYRGVQEALANVARHSGARGVTIRVRPRSGGVAVSIVDDGRGFEPRRVLASAARAGRLGLVGITERVRLLGGVLTITSVPGAGTSVKIVLPAWSPQPQAAEAHSS
jgi:signal transduction histidine kinase